MRLQSTDDTTRLRGAVSLRVCAGVVSYRGDASSALARVIELLASRRVVYSAASISDVAWRWDLSVGPARMQIELKETTPPHQRQCLAARRKIARIMSQMHAKKRAERAGAAA